MSCALAGLLTGPGVGPGRPGTGFGRANCPGDGAGEVGAADEPGPGVGPGRRGGCGRTAGGPGRGDADGLGAPPDGAGVDAAGAAGAAGSAPPASRAPRSRRATGASTVLDADLTNSPMSFRVARTVLLSTPSSLASS
ncbi:hypothetical protein ACPL_8396 [Actinoplanes sp. SE50/110]|nr:hypothetical protein ACPL_8396 [Actinoplanes sp. SE50/110]SLM03918.1 hypothetical protein ACSP50_7217 [Actinoplanes sp. SE50/110]